MSNTNCLVGWRCPDEDCESEGPFWIDATIEARVLMSDAGTVEEDIFGTTWEEDAYCRCQECGHEGEVKDFCSG